MLLYLLLAVVTFQYYSVNQYEVLLVMNAFFVFNDKYPATFDSDYQMEIIDYYDPINAYFWILLFNKTSSMY